MDIVVSALSDLLRIVRDLNVANPAKKFTLDGRLLGDIGEVMAERNYAIRLLPGLARYHDAKTEKGKKHVQVKVTMKDSLTFPARHVPVLYLGLKILQDGSVEEVYNGPGKVIADLLAGRNLPRTNLHSVPIDRLRKLSATIPPESRVPHRCYGCLRHISVSGPRQCPECGRVFKGKGWDGIDAHWKARHLNRLPYASFRSSLCKDHR